MDGGLKVSRNESHVIMDRTARGKLGDSFQYLFQKDVTTHRAPGDRCDQSLKAVPSGLQSCLDHTVRKQD
jgi:hypothetical protein